MDIWTIEFDGSCWPNPGGKACFGYIIYKNGIQVQDGDGIVGDGPAMSNNVAEFAALIVALKQIPNYAVKHLVVKGDSQLVINVMSGRWQGKKGLYRSYALRAKFLAAQLRKAGVTITFQWIPREQNQKCDDLSKINNPTAAK